MLQNKSLSLNINETSTNYPWTAKRTWQLTIDNPEATKSECFFAIQANFTGTTTVLVCVDSGLDDGRINPVYIPYSGAYTLVSGVGIVSTGTDAHGTVHTTNAVGLTVIAYGGNRTEVK